MAHNFKKHIKGHNYQFAEIDELNKAETTFLVYYDDFPNPLRMRWFDEGKHWKLQAEAGIPDFVYDSELELSDAIDENW